MPSRRKRYLFILIIQSKITGITLFSKLFVWSFYWWDVLIIIDRISCSGNLVLFGQFKIKQIYFFEKKITFFVGYSSGQFVYILRYGNKYCLIVNFKSIWEKEKYSPKKNGKTKLFSRLWDKRSLNILPFKVRFKLSFYT